MTCRTCKFLDVPPNKVGKIVPRKGWTYRCLAEIPSAPLLPACVPVGNFWNTFKWPPSRHNMEPDGGEGCTYFELRKMV